MFLALPVPSPRVRCFFLLACLALLSFCVSGSLALFFLFLVSGLRFARRRVDLLFAAWVPARHSPILFPVLAVPCSSAFR